MKTRIEITLPPSIETISDDQMHQDVFDALTNYVSCAHLITAMDCLLTQDQPFTQYPEIFTYHKLWAGIISKATTHLWQTPNEVLLHVEMVVPPHLVTTPEAFEETIKKVFLEHAILHHQKDAALYVEKQQEVSDEALSTWKSIAEHHQYWADMLSRASVLTYTHLDSSHYSIKRKSNHL